jgi:dTDP-4-amino-4,6-dideoxygalactose transaminase
LAIEIPLVDLKAQYKSIKNDIDNAIRRVLESTQFILGPENKALESEIASYCGTSYAVGVASGTDALKLALLACGIKPGDEVITTPFTFFATAEAITQCGATPVFADIDPKTYNIDPSRVETKITGKTRAILPVHLYGQPADMDSISLLAQKHNLKVIEDCAQALGAQALGARYKGKRVGSLGDAGCFSFFPSKVLGAYGDAGMVTADNPEIAERVAMLRNHGSKDKYYHPMPGFNSRLDELQAAILRAKLSYLDSWIELRRQKATLYNNLLGHIAGVTTPCIAPDSHHIFNYYTVRLESQEIKRDALRAHLNEKGIATAVYYPLSLHLQDIYKSLGYRYGSLPESEKAQGQVLSLPMYPELTENKIEQIVKTIEAYVK